jgi:EAL domain-containing protein (putative c-di-GMP-specific phosphodiesterase class I)
LRELGCESGQGYLFGRRMIEFLNGHGSDGSARWAKGAIGIPQSLRA